MDVLGKWIIIDSNRPTDKSESNGVIGAICYFDHDVLTVELKTSGGFSLRYEFNREKNELAIIFTSGVACRYSVNFLHGGSEIFKIVDERGYYEIYKKMHD